MFLEVQNQILNPELYNMFLQQLKKDFQNSGIDVEFIDEFIQEFDFIHHSISNRLKQLLKNGTFKLNELLYRIDISESQISALSKKKPQLSFEDLLAELIMKRILQKVVIKLVHKNMTKGIQD